jgi:hypothetical protein
MKQTTRQRMVLGIFILLCSILMASGCRQRSKQIGEHQRMIGVKIYEIDQEPAALLQEWDELGINTVFAAPSLLSTEFKSLARKHQIETFIIVPIFYDPDALQSNPDLYAITMTGEPAVEEWVEFVCPSREDFREQKIDAVKKLIRELDPDGLSLDFIRHFVFWEKVYPDRPPEAIPNTCFDPHCMQKFQADLNLAIPDTLQQIPEIATWITSNYLTEWTDWKCGLITSMIGDIVDAVREIKPGIMINLHAVPWRQNDFGNAIRVVTGQDFSDVVGHVDMLSPMTYAYMVKQKPEWVSSVVRDIAGVAKCRIVPSIQVNEAYLTEPLTADEFGKSLVAALKEPSSGVIFWSWEQLEARPEKKAIVRSVLNE